MPVISHPSILVHARRICFALLYSGLLLLGSDGLQAQTVRIETRIDTTRMLIGEQLHLQYSIRCNPQQTRIELPALPDTFNHFELVQRSKPDTISGRDETTYKQTFTITNFDSGVWKIPPAEVEIKSLQGGEPEVRLTDSFMIQVQGVAVDTAKPIKPIFGIRAAKMPVKQWLLYGAGILLLLAILAFLIWYFIKTIRQKGKKPEPVSQLPVLLPHEKALKALEDLQGQHLWEEGQEKLYHTLLTDIIRSYLEEQFQLDCFEKTSTEIMHQAKRIKAISTSRSSLRLLFETADMVKFAKGKPLPEEHIQCLQEAMELVKETYKKSKPLQETGTSSSSNTTAF